MTMTATITFKDNFPSGCPSAPGSYHADGLVFTNSADNEWCSPMVNGYVSTRGYPSSVKVTISADAGFTAFDFVSLDVCNWNNQTDAQAVTLRSGETEVRGYTDANTTEPKKFATDDFTGIDELEIDIEAIAFSNFTFQPSG